MRKTLAGGIQKSELCVSEIGIFGLILTDTLSHQKTVCNKVIGYLVRTKSVETDEGGVMAGASCLDSIIAE
jgi:hypothetical protein